MLPLGSSKDEHFLKQIQQFHVGNTVVVTHFSGSRKNCAAFVVLKPFQSCLSERHSNIPLHLIRPQTKLLYVTPAVMNTVKLQAGARLGCFSKQEVLVLAMVFTFEPEK
jgi:hypothetical protein